MRVYLPATIATLRRLVEDGEFAPISGTAFALTPALRESYTSGDTEELEYAALLDAARASLRLIAAEDTDEKDPPRRVVISADVEQVTPRPDLDAAVVRVAGPVELTQIAAVHVDTAEAEAAVVAAAAVIDAADLGDDDAEFALGEAEDHELAWYAPQELPFLLELL
ncbi:hypothetical protein L3Q67_16420 [Saccharothrix sp. AJ9571]|nr:hypothetical protein L3Q67_16420 [Saccharothrix sp. AJ9571]